MSGFSVNRRLIEQWWKKARVEQLKALPKWFRLKNVSLQIVETINTKQACEMAMCKPRNAVFAWSDVWANSVRWFGSIPCWHAQVHALCHPKPALSPFSLANISKCTTVCLSRAHMQSKARKFCFLKSVPPIFQTNTTFSSFFAKAKKSHSCTECRLSWLWMMQKHISLGADVLKMTWLHRKNCFMPFGLLQKMSEGSHTWTSPHLCEFRLCHQEGRSFMTVFSQS